MFPKANKLITCGATQKVGLKKPLIAYATARAKTFTPDSGLKINSGGPHDGPPHSGMSIKHLQQRHGTPIMKPAWYLPQRFRRARSTIAVATYWTCLAQNKLVTT